MVSSLSLVSWLRGLIAYIKDQFKNISGMRVKRVSRFTTQNKADEPQASLERDNQTRK